MSTPPVGGVPAGNAVALVARLDLSRSVPGLRRVRGHEVAHLRGHRLLFCGGVLLAKQATERAFRHVSFIGTTRPRLNRRV